MLLSLSRADDASLRDLLIAATAGDRDRVVGPLGRAPIEMLPSAAAMHRVSGSVRKTLATVDGVPARVMTELEAAGANNALRHLGLIGALHEIASVFDGADLAWLVMKGPVLAAHFYGDIGDRGYADLDLLVDHRDFPRAVSVLEDLGFRHVIRNWRLAEEMLAGQIEMCRGPVRIDLHWQLHYGRADRRPFDLRPSGMISRSRRVDVSSVSVPTFDAVDTVVTLAFHAARSGGHALIWSKDLERALVVDQPDLDQVIRSSEATRCAPAVGLMLARARDLLGAPVPDEVVARLVPRSLGMVDRAAARIAHPVQFGRRGAVTRFVMRSAGPSTLSSVVALPARARRQLRGRLRPPAEHETDDQTEKATYLRAVAAASDG
jgi:hypothetical protein